ncbi:probable cytochrome P450 6g2 [Drosophila grimshawi]|uniref:GH22982 n=1 Tax=Drosophila grimshawi TaxID=7222 RepID=B4JW70_DROGR|nr:probable cytochrome P450 6g2 [Drosophila grimshawi]EDV98208.1 GH22982 [Drosophila grimshawi]
MAFGTLLLLLIIILVSGYYFLRQHYDYWIRQDVPQLEPSLFLGNLGGLLSMQSNPADFIAQLYNHPDAQDKPFVGIHVFHKPALLLRDPALIKRIMVKDFPKFANRYSNSDYKGDPLGSQNIFFLKNPAWKEVRLKLSPFFTSTRLKHMFPLINEVGCNLDAYLRQQPLHNERARCFDLEAKELCALYTTDVIATVAYGVQANSFTQPNSEFRRHGRAIFEFSWKRAAEFTLVFFLPQLVPYLGFKVVPAEPTAFMRKTINYVIAEREKSKQPRNDLIDLLIDFKRSSKNADNQFVFEGDILVAQAVLFFTAGFESSSSTMAFAMYELARNPSVQQRLREEIKTALIASGGCVTQQLIESLEYMQMTLQEVLRMYPPLPFLDRECTSDNGYSLAPFHKFRVPKGMPIYIPAYGLHMDPQYYPEPRQFQPERFSARNRKEHTPYTYMPFGLGQHGCIGERYGFLLAKVGLVYVLRNHLVTTSERTQRRMKLDPKAIILQAAGGIHLRLVRDSLGV